MTRPVETQSSSGPSQPRIGALVAEVRSFLEVWRDIFGAAAAWVPAQIEVLRRQALSLQARARELGADGLSHDLGACAQCLEETPVDRAKLARCLRNASELAWQLRERNAVASEETPSAPLSATALVSASPAAPRPSAPRPPRARPPSTPSQPATPSAAARPSPAAASPSLPAAASPSLPAAASPSLPAAPPVAPPLAASPIVSVPAAPRVAATPRAVATPTNLPRPVASERNVADEPPSLQVLLELGSASVAGQSPPPPAEPTPGVAEIEGFPLSERPGAIQDLFATAELPLPAPAAPSLSPASAAKAVQGPPPLRPGRTTLPFGAPAFEAPAPAPPPAMYPPIAPELGRPQVVEPPAQVSPGHDVLPEPGPLPPYAGPGWSTPPVSGIRWGLVLLIISGLGGAAALLLGLGLMPGGSVVTAPDESALGGGQSSPSPGPPSQELDDAGFAKLLAQVHAVGTAESPALRALLDAEAGASRHAPTPTCAAGSVGCLLSPNGGERSHYRPLGDPPRGERPSGPWLMNLRLPGIGVAADPRVRALFEFHTEHAVGREIFQDTLFQCGAYQALIREVLIRHDVPLDLSALAMVASGCVADVESPTGARGLWQVSPLTARAYDLRIIPGVIDERLDPMKSTAAAVAALADLRQKTGSWELAAASFAVGPFELLARLVRAGAQGDFWRLADADPLLAESAGFVAKVQAYALILSNLDRYHFQDPPPRSLEVAETVEVPAGTLLGLVARAAGTSTTRIRDLNPDLLGSSVPTEPHASFVIRVPQAGARRARERLPLLLRDPDGAEQCVPHHFDWGRQRFTRNMAYRCQQAAR